MPVWDRLYRLSVGPDGRVGNVAGLAREQFEERGKTTVVYSNREA